MGCTNSLPKEWPPITPYDNDPATENLTDIQKLSKLPNTTDIPSPIEANNSKINSPTISNNPNIDIDDINLEINIVPPSNKNIIPSFNNKLETCSTSESNDKSIDLSDETAAITIQKIFRGHSARHKLEIENSNRNENESNEKSSSPNETKKSSNRLLMISRSIMEQKRKNSIPSWQKVSQKIIENDNQTDNENKQSLNSNDSKSQPDIDIIPLSDQELGKIVKPTITDFHEIVKLAVKVEDIKSKWEKKKNKYVETVHSMFDITVAIMISLRNIANLSTHLIEDIIESDYTSYPKYIFPPEGSSNSPPHSLPYPIEFKDYCPKIFYNIRQIYNIKTTSYLGSLATNLAYIEYIANSKSGQYFFYTNDKKYLIKTMKREESIFIRSFLKDYYHHLSAYPHSLLAKIFGIHRIKFGNQSFHFMILGNIFNTKYAIHQKYDIKGSSVGRNASNKEKLQLCPVLKDNDFLSINLYFSPETYEQFTEQLLLDSTFLSSHNIMDYSLLIGIHDKTKDNNIQYYYRERDMQFKAHEILPDDILKPYQDSSSIIEEKSPSPQSSSSYLNPIDHFIPSICDNYLYFVGIIDILQYHHYLYHIETDIYVDPRIRNEYNNVKQLENFWKSLTSDGKRISCVKPKFYSTRFFDFIKKRLSTSIPPS